MSIVKLCKIKAMNASLISVLLKDKLRIPKNQNWTCFPKSDMLTWFFPWKFCNWAYSIQSSDQHFSQETFCSCHCLNLIGSSLDLMQLLDTKSCVGSGLKIITGYALAACSPTTKCWHQVDPLQKRPMDAFSQFSPLGEALPEPLPHITNLKPKDFILHILYFQWMPFYKVCKKSGGVAGSFCKKSVKSFEEDYKNLGTSALFF